jgi:hypothetical protein
MVVDGHAEPRNRTASQLPEMTGKCLSISSGV